MKIISKFKDYYDYLAHIYGVDNTVVLNRLTVSDQQEDLTGKIPAWLAYLFRARDVSETFSLVIVAGRIFIIRADEKYNLSIVKEKTRYTWFHGDTIYRAGDFNQSAANLCKELKRPIIELNYDYRGRIMVSGNTPNLSKLGIASYIDANDLYLALTAFIQEMRGDPDKMPDINITDVEKAEAAGFDRHISFRHRK